MRIGWQTAEDSSGWMLGRGHVDLFQRNEQRFHKNVLVGNSSFDHQENEQTCY